MIGLPGPLRHFWAVALKGAKSCRTQGESVRLSVCPYICLYVHLPIPSPLAKQILIEPSNEPKVVHKENI